MTLQDNIKSEIERIIVEDQDAVTDGCGLLRESILNKQKFLMERYFTNSVRRHHHNSFDIQKSTYDEVQPKPSLDADTYVSRHQMAEILKLAAQLQIVQDYSLEDIILAGEEAGIPPSLIQQAALTVLTEHPCQKRKPLKQLRPVFQAFSQESQLQLTQAAHRFLNHLVIRYDFYFWGICLVGVMAILTWPHLILVTLPSAIISLFALTIVCTFMHCTKRL